MKNEETLETIGTVEDIVIDENNQLNNKEKHEIETEAGVE